MMNRPGDVVRILNDDPRAKSSDKSFFTVVKGNQQNSQFWGEHTDSDLRIFRKISFAPKDAFLEIESITGVPLPDLLSNENFKYLSKILSGAGAEFGISKIARAGIRFFYFNRLPTDVLSRFSSLISDDLTKTVSEHLGDITDFGLNFDGTNENGIQYHLKIGPFLGANETSRYLNNFVKEFDKETDYNFICDLDMYETNLEILWDKSYQWWRPLAQSAHKLITKIEKITSGIRL